MGTGKVTLPPLSRLIVMPIAMLMVMLTIGACGNGDLPPTPLTDPSTTPTVEAASVPNITTSAVVGTDSSTTGSTESLTDPTDDRVGSQAKFEELVDAVYARLGRFAAPRDEVPFPDATNPDPVIALQGLLEFHYWVMSTNPWRDWVPLYALDGSRYSLARRNQADRYGRVESLLFFDASARFRFQDGTVVDLETLDPVLDQLPTSAVAIEFTSTVGDFYVAVVTDGRVTEQYAGWTDLTSHAILAAVDSGWRIAYIKWNDS